LKIGENLGEAWRMKAAKRSKKSKAERKDGVTVASVSHPRYRWRVSYPSGGERKQSYFGKRTGEGGADEFADKKREELKEEGAREAEITPAERRALHRFREEVSKLPGSGSEATLAHAVDAFLATLKSRHKALTIGQVSAQLLKRIKKGGAGASHVYTITKRLDRFEGVYGDWLACDLSPELIGEFIDGLSVGAQTQRHYRAAISQLFEFAVQKGAAEFNPVAQIPVPKVVRDEPGILTPKQVKALLTHAPADIAAPLAIGFFAGLRRSELERLDWSEIDFNQGFVKVQAKKTKTAKRRLAPLLPNLKKWLQPHRQLSGPLMPSEMIWRTRLAEAMKGAKIEEWPHNAPRHSFASYRLAATNDAAKVALELGHSRADLLFEHYRALVSPQAARAYWKVAPPAKAKGEKIIQLEERRAS
jgi:integrase